MFQIYELTKFNSLHYLVVIVHVRLLLKRIGSILHWLYLSQQFFENFLTFFGFFVYTNRLSNWHISVCFFFNYKFFDNTEYY